MAGGATGRVGRLAVLLSGTGRTLSYLLDAIESGALRATVPLVVASRDCPGVQIARRRGVEDVRVIPGEIPAAELERLLEPQRIDLVVLAGYLKLVHVPERYAGRVVNIHPAPLPRFGGRGMYGRHVHEAVLSSGVRMSGCTVHLVDGEYDHGPTVLSREVPVEPGDTAERLAARVFEAERAAYPEAIARLLEAIARRG